MFNSRHSLRVLLVVSVIVLSLCVGYSQTALNNDAVIKMATAGLGEDVILSMINTQPGSYSVTPDSLIALKKAGVSDKVIGAMVSKGQPGATNVPNATAPIAIAVSSDPTAGLEVGVYTKKKDQWVEVLPEVVNWKTGGVLKNIASGGLVKGDVNGHIEGGHSKNGVLTPLEFLIKAPEGVAITEYQLIRLRDDKDSREFRTVTGGVLHVSGGATRDIIPFEGKKTSNRTYSITLPNLGIGEYGFLPPGAITSSSSASIGKMYTFRVAE